MNRHKKIIVGSLLAVCMLVVLPTLTATRTDLQRDEPALSNALGLNIQAGSIGSSKNLQEQNSRLVSGSTHAYVDTKVHLTRNMIPTLTQTLELATNSQVKHLIQALIDLVNEKGIVTSQDVKTLVDQLGYSIDIFAGFIASQGIHWVSIVPGYFLSHIRYLGFVAVGTYWSDRGIYDWYDSWTRVNFQLYKNIYHEVYIIGFVGLVWNTLELAGDRAFETHDVIGVSSLVIVAH